MSEPEIPGAGLSEASPALVLHLDGFEGPMELLLELARLQKVDLARISILSLVEQYLAVIEGAQRIRLELAADWLVMAAWLTWLKSRLLLPAGTALAEEAEEAAEVLAARLDALTQAQEGARWLAGRPQLGFDVFGRGSPERLVVVDRSALSADLAGLLSGYTAAVRRRAAKQGYEPRRPAFWTVAQAQARLQQMLGRSIGWTALERFMPEGATDAAGRRTALASTLVAGLEMARGGAADLRQDQAFGPIFVRGAGAG